MIAPDDRKKRINPTPELLRVIRAQVASGKTNKEISSMNDVSLSFARTICNKITQGLTDAQILNNLKKQTILNQRVISAVSAVVNQENADNVLSQRGITEELSKTGIRISQLTICRTLNKLHITRKRLSLVPNERNSPSNIEARKAYGRAMENKEISDLVYLDETGFNLHTS